MTEQTETPFSEEKVNVFISYSWDDDEHKDWVIHLAKKIEAAGGNPLLDQKNLKFGNNIPLFMETMIVRADVVLLILTPKYKLKADNRSGGVGYEYNIINGKLYSLHQNEKYIPVLRNGNHDTSVPLFLQSYRYADLTKGTHYQKNLDDLLGQILNSKLKHPENQKHKEVEDQIKYEETGIIEHEIRRLFHTYFREIFEVTDTADQITAGGAVIKTNPKRESQKLQHEITRWEQEIIAYCEKLQKAFDSRKMQFFATNPNEFKSKAFRNELWTVSAALKTPDPELARYKKEYASVSAAVILESVKTIIERARAYSDRSINYDAIPNISGLGMEFLNEDEMFLKQVIGFGVRSEILHRMFPAKFPVMTQRTLWAMYFMTDRASEFIKIDHKTRSGTMRVSHNWQYDYARFTFFNNYISNLLQDEMKRFGITLKPELRFGYVNLFLVELAKLFKDDIKVLHEWAEI
jgi:hypothetical protein